MKNLHGSLCSFKNPYHASIFARDEHSGAQARELTATSVQRPFSLFIFIHISCSSKKLEFNSKIEYRIFK